MNSQKFWSCGQEKMIFFRGLDIGGCCANLKTGNTPFLGSYLSGAGKGIDIDELANNKREHLASVRRGEIPKVCEGCPALQLMDPGADNAFLFNDINIGHHTACNTDCYYCNSNSNSVAHPTNATNGSYAIPARKAPPLFDLLKEMVERQYIDPDAIIRFGGGEPTILPEFEKLVDYFLSVDRKFFIATSGVRHSPAIERMLQTGRDGSRVVISTDSVTPETYEIIKGLDLSHRVWENIRRYVAIDPSKVEVKYIVLPENPHETREFVLRCVDIGVRRVAIDFDSRPIIKGIPNTLNDDMIEGTAILIYEAIRRGLAVYHSGSGMALWEAEEGERRVNAVLARLSNGRVTMVEHGDGSIHFARTPQELQERQMVEWGRFDNAKATQIHSESRVICLHEDASYSSHRVEQNKIEVTPDEIYTIDVTARARGRSKLIIELRGDATEYTRAVYDLRKVRVESSIHRNSAAVGAIDDEWVRCQLSLKMASSMAHFTVGLVDQQGAHIYKGEEHAGVDVFPAVVGRAAPLSTAP